MVRRGAVTDFSTTKKDARCSGARLLEPLALLVSARNQRIFAASGPVFFLGTPPTSGDVGARGVVPLGYGRTRQREPEDGPQRMREGGFVPRRLPSRREHRRLAPGQLVRDGSLDPPSRTGLFPLPSNLRP